MRPARAAKLIGPRLICPAMATPSTHQPAQEQELLRAARRGDEDAYRRLMEPYRAELHAHCYRMLGSLHDAEDAFQEASLRAWRALAKFEGRSSLRSWLYTIATNACLTAIERRPKRVLPIDYGPATDPHTAPGEPIALSTSLREALSTLIARRVDRLPVADGEGHSVGAIALADLAKLRL